MATVRRYRGHWVADYYDANRRRHIERPEGHFESPRPGDAGGSRAVVGPTG